MLKKTYLCDLCSDQRPLVELVPIAWVDNTWFEIAGPEAPHHLCKSCLGSAHSVWEKLVQGLVEAKNMELSRG